MWNIGEEVNENGEPVKLYLPLQAPPRKANAAPQDSHIGGFSFLEDMTPSCDVCQVPMTLLVQLRIQECQNRSEIRFDRYFCLFACPCEECFAEMKFDKGFCSGGNGIMKCLERKIPTKPSLPVAPAKSSWYTDGDNFYQQAENDDWGIDEYNVKGDKEALEDAVATMERNLNEKGALNISSATNNIANDHIRVPSSGATLENAFGCHILTVQHEPMPVRPIIEEDDVGLSESDEKIRNMLARYMAEEEDEDILAALHGTDIGGGGGRGEEDERLSDEDRILRGFQDRLRRAPRQILRFAPGGKPLWSIPDKNRKTGKKLWQVPICSCGCQRIFEFQVLPSILATLEVDKFARKTANAEGEKVDLDDLLSNGMNFGSVAVFACPSYFCEAPDNSCIVVQESVDERGQHRNDKAVEQGRFDATMAVVEDLDDDADFEPDA